MLRRNSIVHAKERPFRRRQGVLVGRTAADADADAVLEDSEPGKYVVDEEPLL